MPICFNYLSMIYLEFAYVLGIDPGNVAKVIMNRLNIEDETKAG